MTKDQLFENLGKHDIGDIVPLLRLVMVDNEVSATLVSELRRLAQKLKRADPKRHQRLKLDRTLEKMVKLSDGSYMTPQRDHEALSNDFAKHLDSGSPTRELTSAVFVRQGMVALEGIVRDTESMYKEYLVSGVFVAKLYILVPLLKASLRKKTKAEPGELLLHVVRYLVAVTAFGGFFFSKMEKDGFAQRPEMMAAASKSLERGESLVARAREAESFEEFYSFLYNAFPHVLAAETACRFCSERVSANGELVGEDLARFVHAEEMRVRIATSLTMRGMFSEEVLMRQLRETVVAIDKAKGSWAVEKRLLSDVDMHFLYPRYIKDEARSWCGNEFSS